MPLFPYPNMQELNLDWILTKVKNILRFVPDDGAVGQILRRTRSGAEWSDEQGAGGSVISVNGMQGAVVLDAADVGALPDSTSIPTDTADLTNGAGFVTAAGAAAASPVQSVNGQTGTVVLDADDVGALPDSTSIPTDTADLTNGAGFVTAAGAAAAAPVQSVNGQTGTVVLDADDVGALPDTYVAPVTSVNGQTGDVVVPALSGFTLLGTAAGSTPVAISSQYKEFVIDAQYGTSTVYFPLTVVYEQLATSAKLFTVGYYINASTNGFCQFSISDSQVAMYALYINGTNYTSTSNLRVFGR